jgi:hypothetical protein
LKVSDWVRKSRSANELNAVASFISSLKTAVLYAKVRNGDMIAASAPVVSASAPAALLNCSGWTTSGESTSVSDEQPNVTVSPAAAVSREIRMVIGRRLTARGKDEE